MTLVQSMSIVQEYPNVSSCPPICKIIPPHLEKAVRAHKENLGILANEITKRHQEHSLRFRSHRKQEPSVHTAPEGKTPKFHVYTAKHGETLPGKLLSNVDAHSKNKDAYNAITAAKKTYHAYLELFDRNSVDKKGFDLNSTVDFAENYDNAFWDGKQMVYGNGDGKIFGDFTVPLDVIGHELTHGVTQYSSSLRYENQPGALNEHLSDVGGKVVQHYTQSKEAGNHVYDDIIGKGLILPYKGVEYAGLRSMANPGTAYKGHPVLGDDPQPETMADYQDLPNDDDNDNGGVHINSGIPNRAFWLFHTMLQEKGIGSGHLWEIPAQVWYSTSQNITNNCQFEEFAKATIAAVERLQHQGYFDKLRIDHEAIKECLTHSWKVVKVID